MQILTNLRKKNLNKKPTSSEATLFEKLVAMVQLAKREGMDVPAIFLEELIHACVLELYFSKEVTANAPITPSATNLIASPPIASICLLSLNRREKFSFNSNKK